MPRFVLERLPLGGAVAEAAARERKGCHEGGLDEGEVETEGTGVLLQEKPLYLVKFQGDMPNFPLQFFQPALSLG